MHVGAATYLSAYVQLMNKILQIEEYTTPKELTAMGLLMADALSHATRAAWCALMDDQEGVELALEEFTAELKELKPS